MNRGNLTIIGLAFLVLILGCSGMMKGKAAADPAVARFHQQLNDKQFSEIYAESSQRMKDAATEQELIDLLDAVNRKLGRVKDSKSTSWHVGSTTEGTFITVTYDTTFTDGKATEKFIFELDGDKGILVNYNINSNELITK